MDNSDNGQDARFPQDLLKQVAKAFVEKNGHNVCVDELTHVCLDDILRYMQPREMLTKVYLSTLSVRALRLICHINGIDFSTCIEKQELADLLMDKFTLNGTPNTPELTKGFGQEVSFDPETTKAHAKKRRAAPVQTDRVLRARK